MIYENQKKPIPIVVECRNVLSLIGMKPTVNHLVASSSLARGAILNTIPRND
jgi:hypothetical protein